MEKYEGCLESGINENIDIYENLQFVSNGILPSKFKIETPVRHQVWSNLCISFAGNAMAYADACVRYGASKLLSPEFTQKHCKDIDGLPNVTGTTGESFCKVITKYGTCDEELYPFDTSRNGNTKEFRPISQDLYENAKKNKASRYARIATIEAVKDAIVNQNGCLIVIRIFKNFDTNDKGFILAPPKSTMSVDQPKSNHALYVCGYDDDATVVLEGKTYTGFLIIQESYGDKAGSNGYRYLPYELWDASGFYSMDKLIMECWTTYDVNTLQNPNYFIDRQSQINDVMDTKKKTIIIQIGSKNMIVDGVNVEMSQMPLLINGTTLIPLRSIMQLFKDVNVFWDNNEKRARTFDMTAMKGCNFYIGDKRVYDSNGNVIYTSIEPPMIVEGNTMLPIRAFGEVLGCLVNFDNETKTITIKR